MAIDDGVVENFHHGDLTLSVGVGGYRPYATNVDIGDNNYPGVRIIESNGSTTVAESTTHEIGVAESIATGYPNTDSYTMQPHAGAARPAPSR